MEEKKILVAEDEQAIREFVIINLKRSGYTTFEACSGEQALEIFDSEGDIGVAVLDIMMPGQYDGLAVCKRMREKNPAMGIILLTARTQEIDKITGLMTGADDYVTKPFSPSELVARIDALYRRVMVTRMAPEPEQPRESITSGVFTLNLRSHILYKNNKPIELTQVEFLILECFFKTPGMALDRFEIVKRVWGEDYHGEDKVIDVNVRRLRMKIEENPSDPRHIVTVWGLGYRWDP